MADESFLTPAQRIAAERIGYGAQIKPRETLERRDFENALKRSMDGVGSELEFSAHAIDRLQKRNLSLSPDQLQRLNSAVNKAGEKGARESLIMIDNMAMIVSITNRKVITAMDVAGMKDNVVTNIDSAVVS